MEPLKPVMMPTHGVLVGITNENSWQSGADEKPVRLAYIATNSSERLSFVSLQSATDSGKIARVAVRPSRFDDMEFGVVVELHMTTPLLAAETVWVSVAQAGATVYYPPQQIDDL